MATVAKGTAKVVSYKKETAWGTPAGAASGKQLRRVTADFNLTKDSYESAEIRTDRQMADFRHGVRSAEGSLSGELSAGTYADFIGSILARDFTAVALGGSVQTTVTVAGSVYKFVRTVGSWLVSGFQPGMVVQAAGLSAPADNAKNFLIIAATTLEITVVPLNGVAPVAQAVASAVTFTAPGKQTFVPETGHTEQSYSIEQWFSDIQQSEVYTGMKPNSLSVSLPSTGLTTVDIGFMGKDLSVKGTTQYFTAPSAQNTNGIFAAVNGAMIVAGVPVALITSADFAVERAQENATAVGSNAIAEIFTGRISATGNLNVYFMDAQFRDYFDAETPVSIVMALAADNSPTAQFVSFTLPKVKLNTHTVDDGELGLTATMSFQALKNDVVTNGLLPTTIVIQDSQA